MANYPNIHNLKLENCCTDTIDRINRRLKLGNILSVAIGAGVWVNIFGPSPSTLNTIVAVKQTDFATLKSIVQATAAIPVMTRAAAQTDCEGQWFKHIGNNKLEKFWKAMGDVFNG